MADVESNIHVNIDTSDALASLKLLQRQISAFHTQMAKSGTAAAAVAANQAQNLMNSINATGQFQASMRTVTSSTESFTDALERNKLTSREYFRYTGAATKTFGRLFRSEFDTLNKVARERVKDIQTQYIKLGRGANGALQSIAVRPLTLDMKNLGTQTAIAAQRQQLLNQLLKQGSTNLLNFGKNTQWAGRQLMVGFTVPLAMLGTTAAKTFMKLEEQAIRFKRVYGEMFTTQEETDAMVKNIQKLAQEYTKYGVAVEETMKMAADAAAMGKQGADLMAQIAQATRLAVLGGVEQAQALETTISVTNAFGVATEDLAKKIDFLNAVENQTVVSIEDLTIAIPKAGPVVQQLGGDVEDLAFFLTAMKEGGINASEGANALKSGLASLINPSEKASKMLAGLGVNIRGIVESNKGDIKATVVGFAQALDTLDPLNRARAIEQLFGKFQFSRLSTLFQNVTAQGTQAQRVLQLTSATTEELAILSQRELDKIQNTTTYKFKKSMEDLKVAIAPVGEQFLKALTPIVEFVGKILEKFNGLGDGSKKFLTIFTVAVAGIGPVLLMTFGLIANAVANIIKLFAGMKSMYNRTGGASKVLGEQTNYLTKEQLEASAVAASLDQVHTKLKQTFTSETTAVNMLANAYKRAIAAQMGFTGPPAGKRMPKLKYSTGTTRVPGQGNKDTVPSVLTPGEAVIPQKAAQDPANRPFIAHMVAGGTIQGFNGGTTDAQPVKMSATHVGGRSEPRLISDIIKAHPEMTDNQRLKLITMQQVLLSQGLPAVTTTKHGLMFDFPLEINKQMYGAGIPKEQFINEWIKGGAAKWHRSGMTPVQAQALDDAFLNAVKDSKSAMINDDLVKNLFEKEIPNRISPNDPGYQKAKSLYITDYRFNMGQGLGTTPASSHEILSKAAATPDPNNPGKNYISGYEIKTVEASGKGREGKIVTGTGLITLNPGIYDGFEIKEPTTVNMNRLGAGTTPTFSKQTDKAKARTAKPVVPVEPPKLIDLEKAMEHKEKLRAVAIEASQTVYGAKKPTNFGVQETQSSGRSNFMSTIGGVYTKPDGKKVFVKPMLSELDAIAEKRATEIARTVHGLASPKQSIRTMIDPTDIDEPDVKKKRKVIVLESPFDPRFDPNTMPKTFTERDYFRQLVASSLRADKDLKKGNIGGNVLADVGAAGVFDKASGARSYSAGLPSMQEIAMHNLKGVPGANANASPFWFGNATADIPQNIQSADQYEKSIKDEINRTLPKLRKTIDGFKLADGDPAKKVYEDMYKRLQAGLEADWKKVYHFHRSILVKPDEVLQDKNGNIKPIPTEPNTVNLKSTSGKTEDSRLAPKSVAKAVRQGPKGRIVGKADAPHINISEQDLARNYPRGVKKLVDPAGAVVAGAQSSIAEAKAVGSTIGTTLSQSAAAASRTALYGTGPMDADAKSVRRRLQKIEREEIKQQKKTQARAAASKTALYGGGAGTVTPFEKSLRRKGYTSSQIAEQVGYQQKIISEKAAASAAQQTPSRRAALKAKAQAGAARFKGKGGGVTAGLGIAAGATMIGSMAPGKVGEISQKLMMPLMGLSMVLPMLKSPMSAVAIGLLATVGAIAALRMAFDKAANEVIEEGEKFKASTSAINSIAKFSGKVTASEQMDLKRKNSFNMTPSATGKTTYGEAFVQTEEGKAITKRLSEQNAKGKGGEAIGDLSNQLTNSVMSGALDMNQAKSLAMNAARQAGDVSMGIKVIAQMEKILGPNGQDLEKNPLQVRIDMVAQNSKRMKVSADRAASGGDGFVGGDMIRKLAGQKTMQIAGIGASALGGAAAGAGIGTFIGGPIGAAIGGGIGAAVGAAFGYFTSKKYVKQAAVLGATAAVDAKIAMEQNKQMLDSFDMFYQKKIEELKLQGKINEAEELQGKYIEKRNLLTAAQAQLQADVVSQYDNAGGLQESMMSGMKKATTAKYKNDPNQLAYLDSVNQQAGDLRSSGLITSGQEYLIQAKMASGDIPPSVFRTLLGLAAENKDIAPKMMNIITKFSGATSESIGTAAGVILDAKGDINKTVQTEFITTVNAFEKDSDALDFTKNIIKLNNLNKVIPSDVLVSYYSNKSQESQDAYKKLNEAFDGLEAAKVVDIPLVYKLLPQLENSEAFDETYFNSLKTDAEKRTYVTTIASVVNIPDPVLQASQDFIDWQKQPTVMIGKKNYGGANYATLPIATQLAMYREEQGFKAVTEGVGVDSAAAPVVPDGGGGSKVQSSPLDDLVKKLRDVRKNQIKVTEGWSASRKALDGLFGGKKTIDVFSGIENDLRKLGGSQDFIELIVGMDPKVYEEKKNSLFVFDNKKNIVGLKRDAKNIQEAMNSIAMGDWNSSMEAESKALSDQGKAFDRIAALGVPVANAYDLITDKTIAQAIANGVNDKTLKSLIAKYKGLTAAQEKSAAVAGVKTDIAQFKKDRVQEARIKAKYDPATSFAIDSDENLKSMENAIAAQQSRISGLIAKGADKAQIMAAQTELTKMVTDFDERLNQLKNTIGFMQDMFDKGYSNAMESFDVQETALNIQFKLDTKSKDTLIKEAQDQIAAIQYKVDDKEAALKAIEDQEQKINDKYDERIKALDEVEKANAAISNQQKGQLTLAEALTSGDIAAAARAAQDMRAQQAADAVTKQKDAVEQSRQYELDGVTGIDKTDGKLKTRKQLEKEIKDLQEEVFKIEEDKIEPAQEFIRLRQIQLDKDIEGITVLGRTRDAWEAIKNQVDLALIKSAAFVDSMGLAISTQSKLIAAYAAETGGKDGAFNNVAAFVPAVPVPGETPEQKAAREAKDAAAKAAADKAAADKAAADKAAADKLAAEKARLAAIDANSMVPSFLASQESGAIGAASIAAKMAAAATAAAVAKNASTLANFRAKENAENAAAYAAANAKGRVGRMNGGIIPKMFSLGGFAKGTDTVPAMLTPGEFIMSKYAVDTYGVDTMRKINNGESVGGAVYNNTYTLTVNAKTNANPNEIAQAVMSTIKQVDDRRVRGVVLNGR
jgi:TP901 family phage tail tape measure protein